MLIKSRVNPPNRDLEHFVVTVRSKMPVCVPVDIGQELSLCPIKNCPLEL